VQHLKAWNNYVMELDSCRYLHGSWKCIIGTLQEINKRYSFTTSQCHIREPRKSQFIMAVRLKSGKVFVSNLALVPFWHSWYYLLQLTSSSR
jgi:hypothetical protein